MKSECRGCGEVFSSLSSFDVHRTGSFGQAVYDTKGMASFKHQRRCMTEQEMLDKGLVMNEKGWWTSGGTFDRSIFSKSEVLAAEEQENSPLTA